MLNARLYRAAFVPFLFALAISAFSLGRRPEPLSSTLAPDAFEGGRAFGELQELARLFPARRPGSSGDERMARRIAATLEGLGGTAGGGFSVKTRHFEGQTINGEHTLTTVIAERPGSMSATPIVIVAHRDAAAPGSQAELSGTAVLMELARVFASRETKRTIVLVSTSGGSGGAAGASELAATQASTAGAVEGDAAGPFDAAIVLGDLAGSLQRSPFVVPYSDSFGSAPLELQRTVADAIQHEVGRDPGAPSVLGQFAHLVFPLAVGEQGVLDGAGLPAVLVQVSGERGPSPHERVSPERLQAFGRAVLSSIDALDTAPDVSHTMETSLVLDRNTLPAWVVALLVGTLIFPVLIVGADGLARLRRRRRPVAQWTLWTLSCALPFFTCAVFAYLLGVLGIVGSAPSIAVLPGALPFDGKAVTAVVAVALTFALAWLLWSALVRRLGWGRRPDGEVAGLAMLLVALALTVIVWLNDPFTALLLLPALHLWLLLASPELRPGRLASLLLVALGLLPLVLIVGFYADQLGMGVGDVAWTALLLLAGGNVGILGATLWSLGFGCVAAATMLALAPEAHAPGSRASDLAEVTIRGPMSYAGPGSLGGTESALRR